MDKFKMDTKKIVAIAIGSALYAVLSIFVAPITIAPNTSLKLSLVILSIFGAMFGPVVGFLVGFIGHAFTDLQLGYGIWWGWVLYSGIMGLSAGLIYNDKTFSLKNGVCTKIHIIKMAIQTFVGIVVGAFLASVIDVLFYNEAWEKVRIQIITSSFANSIILLIGGITIIYLLAKSNSKIDGLEN